MIRKTCVLSGLVLSLAACGRSEAPPTPAEPASTRAPAAELAGVDLNAPIRALGTEPFWAVEATPDRGLVLSGVDRPETVAPTPTRSVGPAQAIFAGRAVDGRELVLALTPGPCSDGMSDRTYPLTATVTLAGETLKGCAASTKALDRAPEAGEVR